MQEVTRQQYLQAMGIQLWEGRVVPVLDVIDTATENLQPEHLSLPSTEQQPADMTGQTDSKPDWPELQASVENCTDCQLHESRIYPVFGCGNRQASVMFIGEAPGADEDRQGEPFVGRAGQLLNEMLLAIGFSREQVYIANILKCRPPNNRDPHESEIQCCEHYLIRQIELVQPDVIVALGRVAAQNLLKSDSNLGSLRGQAHKVAGILPPIMVTYHPAYLLRKPTDKRKVWEDLKVVLATSRQAGDK